MKKTVKSLMVALFVLGAMVMGISCQNPASKGEDLKDVDLKDVVIKAGTYSFVSEMIFAAPENEMMKFQMSEVTKGTVDIKGTEPTSKVVSTIESMTMVMKALDSNTWAGFSMADDETLESIFRETGKFVKDEKNKSIILTINIPEDENTDTFTYEEFVENFLEGYTIKQNSDGTKYVLEDGDEDFKEITTITRK